MSTGCFALIARDYGTQKNKDENGFYCQQETSWQQVSPALYDNSQSAEGIYKHRTYVLLQGCILMVCL